MPTFDAGITGLATVGLTILDSAGAVHVARSVAGITEPVAGSGIYLVAEHDATATLTYVWDIGVGTVGGSETLYAGRGDLAGIIGGVTITQASLGTDGRSIGRVQPYAVVTVYRAGVAEYQFDADPDGDFSYELPAGATWILRARAPRYRDAMAEVTT
jgi:hypothetical protein